MAKTYYAVTKIKHGVRTEDGSQDGKYEQKVFEVGDKVTGLSANDMKSLWHAGALTDQAPAGQDEDEHTQGQEASDDQKSSTVTPAKKATPAKVQDQTK